jgi:hypothetical protein
MHIGMFVQPGNVLVWAGICVLGETRLATCSLYFTLHACTTNLQQQQELTSGMQLNNMCTENGERPMQQ